MRIDFPWHQTWLRVVAERQEIIFDCIQLGSSSGVCGSKMPLLCQSPPISFRSFFSSQEKSCTFPSPHFSARKEPFFPYRKSVFAKNCKRQSSKNVKGGAHRISEAKTDGLRVFDCFLLGLLGTAGGGSLSIITLAQKSIRERPKKASGFFFF